MNIKSLEILACDAGWRNYYFVKLVTDKGIVGWSEFDEGFGAPGVGAVIERLAPRVIGKSVDQHEQIFEDLRSATRPASGGIVALAMGAIENALLDAKPKHRGSVYSSRAWCATRIRVMFARRTWSINPPDATTSRRSRSRRRASRARSVREKASQPQKKISLDKRQEAPARTTPGFGSPFAPELNVDREVIRTGACTSRRCGSLGRDLELLAHLNFRAKTEGTPDLRAIATWIVWSRSTPSTAALGYSRTDQHPISFVRNAWGSRVYSRTSREAMDWHCRPPERAGSR